MKILVTGTEGQVARSIRAVASKRPHLDIRFVGRPELDLSVPGEFAMAIHNARPDVVVNAAAYTAVDAAETDEALAMRINGDAPGEGAVAAAAIGARFVQLSTDYVFDGALGQPYCEDDAVGPINVYGRSKLAGEEAVRRSGGSHLIVRTSWVVSPFGRNFVKTMLRLAAERDEVRVVDDQFGAPTSALHLADALLSGLSRWDGEPGLFHLAGSGSASWCDLAREVMAQSDRLGGPSAKVCAIATDDYPTPARRPVDTRLDCRAFERTFGIHLPDWRDGVGEIVRACLGAGDDR